MAQPPLSAIFSDIQSEEDIDQFYHEQDLKKLRELVQYYSLPITDSQGMDKIYMISLLWREKREIPPHLNLTWGEPYDGLFRQYSLYLPILFEKKDALSGFLTGYISFHKYLKDGIIGLVYGFLWGYHRKIFQEVNTRLFLNSLPIKETLPIIVNNAKEISQLREMCLAYNENGEVPIPLKEIENDPLAMVSCLILRNQGEGISFLGEAVDGTFRQFVDIDDLSLPYQESAIYLTLTKVKQLREFLLGVINWGYYMFDDIGMEHQRLPLRIAGRDELIKYGFFSAPSASCGIPDWRQSDKFLLDQLNALPTIRLIDFLYEAENCSMFVDGINIWDYLDFLKEE